MSTYFSIRQIAQVTGKQHKNVMQAIRNMEFAWEKIAGLKFQLGSYQDANGQLRPCYILTKSECLYIATKFNDEARAKLVLRWEQLEMAEMLRAIVSVTLDIGMRKVSLKALDKAYSIAFPKSTAINVNKKRSKCKV